MNNIISNCPLCEEHSLHVIGEGKARIQQCIWCGYVTSEKYKGKKEDSEAFKNLTDEMKEWAKEENGRIWIPSIFTLPDGLVYPSNNKDKMQWNLAEMKDIPEEEQKNYPVEGQEGKFYERKYDTDNPIVYQNFYEAMNEVNERAKKKNMDKHSKENEVKIKLPKLKK